MPVSAAASKISCCGQLQISTQEDDRKQGKCNCIYHFVSGEFHLSPFFTSDKIICNSPLSAGAQKAYKGTRLFNLTIQTIFQAWSYFMLLTYTSTRELNATVKEWIAAHMEQFSIECWEWFEIALVQKLTPLSQPISCKTKTNHDLFTSVFPRFWFCLFLLWVLIGSSVKFCYLLIGLCKFLGFSFYDTRWKSALWYSNFCLIFFFHIGCSVCGGS